MGGAGGGGRVRHSLLDTGDEQVLHWIEGDSRGTQQVLHWIEENSRGTQQVLHCIVGDS